MQTPIPEIVECLVENDFLNEIKRRGYRKTYKDPNVFNLFLEIIRGCGLDFSGDIKSKEWRDIWKHVVNPQVRKKVKKTRTVAEVMTPLSAIYISLYELYGHNAPKIAYEKLEDIFVEALNGGNPDITLLAVQITPTTLPKQLELVATIIKRVPDLCKTNLDSLLCGVSRMLPKSASDLCKHKIAKICREVASHA